MYLLLSIIVLIALLVVYTTKVQSKVLNKRTGKTVKNVPLLNIIYSALTANGHFLAEQHQRFFSRYPTFQNWLGTNIIWTRDPELISAVLSNPIKFEKTPPQKNGDPNTEFMGSDALVWVNGDSWKFQRKLLTSVFTRNDIFLSKMVEKTESCFQNWQKSSAPLNVMNDLQHLTLDILGSCIFGKDLRSMDGKLHGPLHSYNFIMEHFVSLVLLQLPLVRSLPIPNKAKLLSEIKNFNNYLSNLIDDSKKVDGSSPEAIKSLIKLLVQANLVENSIISDNVIRDNVLVFFLAGHETTTASIFFILYLIAQNPQVQSKLQKEVDDYFDENKEVTYATFKTALPYTSCVIKEAQRLYPGSVGLGGRIISEDSQLGDYFIPKGSLVSINVYALHRSPEYFRDPDSFIPERFADGSHEIQKGTYMPFGDGPRHCIGKFFALQEQKVFLMLLMRKFSVTLAPGTKLKTKKFGAVLAPAPDDQTKFIFTRREK
eukprot:TRINITY_DN11160_c0_g1_i1.p1 TRINITY_DN11160_c0_g1~~TRINITY_DN11160_c0_g1_i1.p1  ORF type:complete len:487 (+),score=77.80 TRINITY_DN11160_c0_g1_i1:104-1564(+)